MSMLVKLVFLLVDVDKWLQESVASQDKQNLRASEYYCNFM